MQRPLAPPILLGGSQSSLLRKLCNLCKIEGFAQELCNLCKIEGFAQELCNLCKIALQE